MEATQSSNKCFQKSVFFRENNKTDVGPAREEGRVPGTVLLLIARGPAGSLCAVLGKILSHEWKWMFWEAFCAAGEICPDKENCETSLWQMSVAGPAVDSQGEW